ncbi:hypothetical protein BZL29_0174 [Mycobacterium kansasii]|uniref:Uncharacterized protein n=1 Tax=Mycobacterium kansasii TaxID=1768 RepID=A0A1V3XWW9_MYCKA|nr:hypothetical protein BZL29_0174 [Mycobacterium kansasii]
MTAAFASRPPHGSRAEQLESLRRQIAVLSGKDLVRSDDLLPESESTLAVPELPALLPGERWRCCPEPARCC